MANVKSLELLQGSSVNGELPSDVPNLRFVNRQGICARFTSDDLSLAQSHWGEVVEEWLYSILG